MVVEEMLSKGTNGEYNFRLELEKGAEVFGCKYATDAINWIRVLRRAKLFSEEIERTKDKKLYININPYIQLYKDSKLKEVEEFIELDFTKQFQLFDFICSEPIDFLTQLREAQDHYLKVSLPSLTSKMIDCIQAYRPFMSQFFKAYTKTYHLNLTNFIVDFWQKKNEEFSGLHIITFLNLLKNQEKIINEYGMSDARYGNSYDEILGFFCIRSFNNVMPMAINVLEEMLKKYFIDKKGICTTHGPTDLFKLVSQLADCYNHCEEDDVLNAILGLCYK